MVIRLLFILSCEDKDYRGENEDVFAEKNSKMRNWTIKASLDNHATVRMSSLLLSEIGEACSFAFMFRNIFLWSQSFSQSL